MSEKKKLPDELLDMGHDDCSICEEAKSRQQRLTMMGGKMSEEGMGEELKCPKCGSNVMRKVWVEKDADHSGIYKMEKLVPADAELSRLRAEVERLKEAVEWACKTITGDDDKHKGEWGDCVDLSWFEPELRRRASDKEP